MSKKCTEARVAAEKWLDRLDVDEALAVMLDNQAQALPAMQAALPQIAAAIHAADKSLSSGDRGRLVYAGAGTSARIAVQDGSELLPTFDWPAMRVDYLIAGGLAALVRPVEGAEDSAEAAKQAADAIQLRAGDVVICLAASGNTIYTLAVARAAKAAGAITIGIANNRDTALLAAVDYPVLLETGAEALAGSTRLKAQKICLNLISTQLMVLQGRVKNGLMSDIRRNSEMVLQGRVIISKKVRSSWSIFSMVINVAIITGIDI